MRKLWIAFLATAAWTLAAAPAVVDGPAPLTIDAKLTGSAAWNRIYVLTVIYPQLAYSVRSGEMLTALQTRYQNKGVEIYGILREPLETVQKFSADHPGFGITLCADPALKSLNLFLKNPAEAFSRAAILNQAGKLLWCGDPIDLDMMLKIITEKRYSEREEIRISALVDQLQAALHAGIPRDVVQCADRILEARPEQLSALNAKAFALEQTGDAAALETMLKTRIARHPEWQESYFLLLDAACRIPALAANRTFAAESYLKNHSGDAEGLNGIAWSLLQNAPFDAEAFQAVRKIVRQLETLPAAQMNGKVFVTRALLAYRECDLPRAQALLQSALKLTTDRRERQSLESLQKYFDAIPQK